MLSAEAAILRTRRDLILGVSLKLSLGIALAASFMIAVPSLRLVAMLLIGAVWVALNFTSARGSRLAAGSPSLIAAGRYEEAEQQIDQAIRAFSLFRVAKLQPLHHLALLRHAQRQWRDSALICRALLRQRLGMGQGMSRGAALILADALLEMNDLAGAHEAILLLQREQGLPLIEQLNLLLVQLDYSWRVEAWSWMAVDLPQKVQLAELMPSEASAKAQALLALAARRVGREDWAQWLASRAALLMDASKLVAERPVLSELWPNQEKPA